LQLIQVPILYKKNYNNQNRDFDLKWKHALINPTLTYKTHNQLSINPDPPSEKSMIVRIGMSPDFLSEKLQ